MNMENNKKTCSIFFNCWLEKNAAIVFFTNQQKYV